MKLTCIIPAYETTTLNLKLTNTCALSFSCNPSYDRAVSRAKQTNLTDYAWLAWNGVNFSLRALAFQLLDVNHIVARGTLYGCVRDVHQVRLKARVIVVVKLTNQSRLYKCNKPTSYYTFTHTKDQNSIKECRVNKTTFFNSCIAIKHDLFFF